MENEILNKILDKLEQLEQKVDNRIDSLTHKVDHGLNSLRGEMSEMNGKFTKLQESVERIEIAQQEDILTILSIMNVKLEDTAKKSDIVGIQADIEFIVRENSLINLELDRLKRQVNA
jgi:hypothetical protein